ncbi:MAG TPA: hypothetical protein PK511_02625 [Chitinophagales bacterium]|nr:hypothetical protein [Chitinophagales bacterium]HMU68634.1 hypothetical protein [Chitinophagales bacterium]HMX05396.1 hypothetical protein [Chitinophagales bacterium]HMZ89219.1 hypothetical protein [Chitinophagales bacterium]HNA57905.1 hypothetical protein [Chitinophagales bacterium]
MKRILTLVLVLTFSVHAYSQSKKDQALEKALTAIAMMDSGYITESIDLLNEAIKLDPDRYDYPYEVAYAYYLMKDYNKSIEVLEKLSKHKDVTDQLYQLLGNSYDIIGDPDKAFDAYDRGLKKFPKSGILFLEKGNVYWGQKKYAEALPFYEDGIAADPMFSSNYYRAARIYCATDNPFFGIMYGEIFLNLEPSTERSQEISALLFDTYKSNIHVTSDTSASIEFCSNNLVLDKESMKRMSEGILPFCMTAETTMLIYVGFSKEITLESVCKLRSSFIDAWYQMGNDKKYNIELFKFQKDLADKGYYDAYNHWLFMNGDGAAFDEWYKTHQDEFTNFANYANQHRLQLNDKTKFLVADFR